MTVDLTDLLAMEKHGQGMIVRAVVLMPAPNHVGLTVVPMKWDAVHKGEVPDSTITADMATTIGMAIMIDDMAGPPITGRGITGRIGTRCIAIDIISEAMIRTGPTVGIAGIRHAGILIGSRLTDGGIGRVGMIPGDGSEPAFLPE